MDSEENEIMDECVPQAFVIERYFHAAEIGDLTEVKRLLRNRKEIGLDIDYTDASGRSALYMAIQGGHLAVLYPLLESGTKIRDNLLRAVEYNFPEAVRILCDQASKQLQDTTEGRAIIDCHCANDDFNHEITPIILAAQKKNFQIIKLLLDVGARIPIGRRDEVDKTAPEDSFQRSVGTMEIYKGLASEPYVAMASNDPVERAFKLCGEIRRLAEIDIEFKLSYQQLELNMQQFATDFISQARSSEEILTVLTYPGDKDDLTNCAHSPLPKISQALDLGLQKFIAHPNCQQVIIAQFYKRLIFVRDKSALYRTLVFAALFLLFPVLAVLHLYSNREKIKTFVRTPIVVFIMYLTSDLTFVTLLTWEAVSSNGSTNSLTRPLNIVVLVWLAGMIWQEIERIAARGFTKVMSKSEHLRDIFIIILFLFWISFEIVALFTVPESKAAVSHHISTRTVKALPTTLNTNFSEGKLSEIGDYVLAELAKTDPNINTTTRLQIKEIVGRVINHNTARCKVGSRSKRATQTLVEERRLDESGDFLQLTWNHPQLIGSAMFALATTLSVLRMMSYVVISNVFGPLQISLVKMIKGTLHFFLVVGAVGLSFAFGMTLIYSTQDNAAEKTNANTNNDFLSIFQSSVTLYWSVFGLMSLDDIHLVGHAIAKEFSGSLLYASFYVLVVVVLLNALIAVWNEVYKQITEDSDVQWKFSCTAMWMTYFGDDIRVPSPFNLLPTPSAMRRLHGIFAKYTRLSRPAVAELSASHEETGDGKKRTSILNREPEEQLTIYKRVIGHLRDRYIIEKTGDEFSTTSDISKEDLRNTRNEVVAFRYETFKRSCEMLDKLEKTRDACLQIRQKSALLPMIAKRTVTIASALVENIGSSDEFNTTLSEMEFLPQSRGDSPTTEPTPPQPPPDEPPVLPAASATTRPSKPCRVPSSRHQPIEHLRSYPLQFTVPMVFFPTAASSAMHLNTRPSLSTTSSSSSSPSSRRHVAKSDSGETDQDVKTTRVKPWGKRRPYKRTRSLPFIPQKKRQWQC